MVSFDVSMTVCSATPVDDVQAGAVGIHNGPYRLCPTLTVATFRMLLVAITETDASPLIHRIDFGAIGSLGQRYGVVPDRYWISL